MLIFKKKIKEALKNVGEAASARQTFAKSGSLYPINDQFEQIFNAAMAIQVVF